MLGLPFESIFAEEVQIGNQTVDGTQLRWSVFHDFPAARMDCIQLFLLLRNLLEIKDAFGKATRSC